MMTPLQKFLFDLKVELLNKEKRAIGIAQMAMTQQIQVVDSMLRFLASQQTEEDMGKLRLTLEKQATPTDDIKPRQDTQELAQGLIELAAELDRQFKAQKGTDKKPIKYTLNNIPAGIKPKSVSSKIYGLQGAGKLPFSIVPRTRTIEEDGQEKEVLYMVRVTDEEAEQIKSKREARRAKGE